MWRMRLTFSTAKSRFEEGANAECWEFQVLPVAKYWFHCCNLVLI